MQQAQWPSMVRSVEQMQGLRLDCSGPTRTPPLSLGLPSSGLRTRTVLPSGHGTSSGRELRVLQRRGVDRGVAEHSVGEIGRNELSRAGTPRSGAEREEARYPWAWCCMVRSAPDPDALRGPRSRHGDMALFSVSFGSGQPCLVSHGNRFSAPHAWAACLLTVP